MQQRWCILGEGGLVSFVRFSGGWFAHALAAAFTESGVQAELCAPVPLIQYHSAIALIKASSSSEKLLSFPSPRSQAQGWLPRLAVMAKAVETTFWSRGAVLAGVWEVILSPWSWRVGSLRVGLMCNKQGKKMWWGEKTCQSSSSEHSVSVGAWKNWFWLFFRFLL